MEAEKKVRPIYIDGKFVFVDEKDNILSGKAYSSATNNGNCWIVSVNWKRGVVDKSGQEIIPCEYDGIALGNDGDLISLWVDGHKAEDSRYGIASIKQKRILAPCKYKRISAFQDGLAEFETDKKGVVDEFGHEYYYGVDNIELIKSYYKLISAKKLILKCVSRLAAGQDDALNLLARTKTDINDARTTLYNLNKKSQDDSNKSDVSDEMLNAISNSIDSF